MSQALFLLDWRPLDRRYLPGLGLAGSMAVHGLAVCGLLFVSIPGKVTDHPRTQEKIAYIDLKDPNDVLYFPELGNDAGGETSTEAPSEAPRPAAKASTVESIQPAVAPSISTPKGLSYPGPQPIVSDFQEPTNSILTVLQPSQVNAPILRPPLALPNIVQFGAVAVPVPNALISPISAKEVQPDVKPVDMPLKAALPAVAIPKPVLPIVTASVPALPVPLPELKSAASRTLPQQTALPTAAKPVEPLLVLTPIPAPRLEPLIVPAGEARGRFSISPDSNLAASGSEPGSKAIMLAANTAPAALPPPKPAAPVPAAVPAVVPTAVPAAVPKDKPSTGTTPADSTRSGRGGLVPGAGTGSSSGISVGTNNNAFPGITILGGASDSGSTRSSGNIISIGSPAPPLQTSYGVTVVSTEGSGGGGLPQYGVFTNEQIFTVYLDMRKTVSDPAPSWTMEYATLKRTTAQVNVSSNPNGSPQGSQQGLVLPFPIVKEQPILPVELVRRYSRLRIIVYGVINVDGKMEQVSVKESPDPSMNNPVLLSLSKWSFRPAQLDGEKVPVKVLIGIPLS